MSSNGQLLFFNMWCYEFPLNCPLNCSSKSQKQIFVKTNELSMYTKMWKYNNKVSFSIEFLLEICLTRWKVCCPFTFINGYFLLKNHFIRGFHDKSQRCKINKYDVKLTLCLTLQQIYSLALLILIVLMKCTIASLKSDLCFF